MSALGDCTKKWNQDIGGYEITGNGGDNTCTGSKYPDVMYLKGGDDVARGKGGRDDIRMGSGADKAWGGIQGDTILGGAGADKLRGENGNDTIRGGDSVEGTDWIWGGYGDDALWEDESISGHDGDVIYGGPDRDRGSMIDGDGLDRFYAGKGNDDNCPGGDVFGDLIEMGPDEDKNAEEQCEG
jgi:hypothetical protein